MKVNERRVGSYEFTFYSKARRTLTKRLLELEECLDLASLRDRHMLLIN